MVQIWESMLSSGPSERGHWAGEQQVSLGKKKAGDCTRSLHCKPLNLRFSPRIGVTGTDYAPELADWPGNPCILGFVFSFTGKVPGTFLLLSRRAPVKGLYRVSF